MAWLDDVIKEFEDVYVERQLKERQRQQEGQQRQAKLSEATNLAHYEELQRKAAEDLCVDLTREKQEEEAKRKAAEDAHAQCGQRLKAEEDKRKAAEDAHAQCGQQNQRPWLKSLLLGVSGVGCACVS